MTVCARGAAVVNVNEIDNCLAVLTISFLVPLCNARCGERMLFGVAYMLICLRKRQSQTSAWKVCGGGLIGCFCSFLRR